LFLYTKKTSQSSQILSMHLQNSLKCPPLLETPFFLLSYPSQSDTEHQCALYTLFIYHLLFVNDVLIFGPHSAIEWIAYKDIFNVLCVSFGMKINDSNYSFYILNVTKM